MNFRDAELLSAYLDGQLQAGEAARLESRLAVDAGLRNVLDDLRVARGLLKRTPRRKASRNFTLHPTDARVRAPRPLAVPVLRYAGALASILFLFSLATNSFGPTMSRTLAAARPSFGMGGGVGGGEPVPPPEALAMAPANAPAAEAPAAPQDSAVPTMEAVQKTAPAEAAGAAPSQQIAGPPIPYVWLLGLALAALLAVGLSWYIDRLTRRNFRSRTLEK
jgi:hypothetical protein